MPALMRSSYLLPEFKSKSSVTQSPTDMMAGTLELERQHPQFPWSTELRPETPYDPVSIVPSLHPAKPLRKVYKLAPLQYPAGPAVPPSSSTSTSTESSLKKEIHVWHPAQAASPSSSQPISIPFSKSKGGLALQLENLAPDQPDQKASSERLTAEQNNGALGSWADRQVLFPSGIPAVKTLKAKPAKSNKPKAEDKELDDVEKEAAWKYRFANKWRREQIRAIRQGRNPEGERDAWDEAICFLDAGRPGWWGHVGESDDLFAEDLMGAQMSGLHTLPGPPYRTAAAGGFRFPQFDDAAPPASGHLQALARKTQELRLRQQSIDDRAAHMWWKSADPRAFGGREILGMLA